MAEPEARQRFEALVADALDGLPDWLAPYLDEVAVQVEDDPPRGQSLYGLYEGVPLGKDPTGSLPPTITLFRRPLERDFGRDPARLRDQVRITVAHEVAHHFGFGEERLQELGYG
jgi:predicted Zn-dependent protease with MMP-like domain